MLNITQNFVSGTGTIPKEIEVNSVIALDASSNNGTQFEWDFLSKPEESNARLYAPISAVTRIGPLDRVGSYLFQLWVDRGRPTQRTRSFSLSVPGEKSTAPAPTPPEFGQGGRVRNFSFELEGEYPGYAAYWDVEDSEGVLHSQGGILRGRIVPTNFIPTKGEYVFCLGDDIAGTADFTVGGEFSISQRIDFTGINLLQMDLKFRK